MGLIDELYIRKFHETKFEKYGSGNSHSLGWFSRESQFRHFEILSHIGNLSNKSVLDIGCGNGDLCQFLNERYMGIDYSGIDLIPAFLDNATELNKNYRLAKFYLGNFMSEGLPEADYVLACGSLNYKNGDPDFIFKALTRLYKQCKIGFGFNLLSRTMNSGGILMTYSAEVIEGYCHTISPRVVLKNDYENGDFTIMMYKNS